MVDFQTLRQRMVDNQIRPREISDHAVIKAFLATPRELFVEPAERPFAYAERELAMSRSAPGRRMLEPAILARLVQALALAPQARAMAVGCGTGYSAAILAQLSASVVAVEEEAELAAIARTRLAGLGADNATIVEAKLTDGYPAGEPYDAILVDGAVETVPDALLAQLRAGGRLAVIARDGRLSRAMLYERVGDAFAKWPRFEASAAVLPGFDRRREFVF